MEEEEVMPGHPPPSPPSPPTPNEKVCSVKLIVCPCVDCVVGHQELNEFVLRLGK